MPRRPQALLAILVLVCAGWLSACGGDDDSTDTSGTTDSADNTAGGLTVIADEGVELAWSPTELSAKPGEVTITLDNPSQIPHNIALEGEGVEEISETVSQDTTTVSANLQPGEYKFYCDVPGHEEAGMDGTLTVE